MFILGLYEHEHERRACYARDVPEHFCAASLGKVIRKGCDEYICDGSQQNGSVIRFGLSKETRRLFGIMEKCKELLKKQRSDVRLSLCRRHLGLAEQFCLFPTMRSFKTRNLP